MQRFLRLLIANPAAVILIVAVTALGGIFASIHLPLGLFPGLDLPVANVITHYPGAAPEDMELLVSRPIEDRVRTIPGIRRVSSKSIEGVSQVTAEFEWGTRLPEVRQFILAELATVQSNLPAGVIPRLENIGTTLEEVASYVVCGGGSQTELRTTVEHDLASRLTSVEGVSRVEVFGGDAPAYIVQLRLEALLRAHLTIRDVTAALEKQNVVVASGFMERGAREYVIRGDSRLQSVEDILAVPLVREGFAPVFVRDVASVQAGEVPRHYEVHGNGLPAVAFIVSKQSAASTIDVVHGVDRQLAEFGSLLPPGAKIHKFYDQADIVTETRDSLFHDLVVGALLAATVLFLFLRTLRATLVVIVAIPVSLFATLALMAVFGQTLNVITLSALTLAVGMVVDDAIIVTENIARHLQSGENSATASALGAAEIAGPDITGTFTTVSAFAPLLFIGGIAGLFVRPFGMVLSAALLASLATSLTVVPVMLGRARTSKPQELMGGSFFLPRLDGMLQRVLASAMSHRRLTILFGAAMLGCGGLATWLGPVNVLPPIDEGAILIEYIMPPGTSLKESDRIGDIVERKAMAQPEVETVYRRTGSPEMGLGVEGVNQGELTLKLAPRSTRKRTLAQVTDHLRSAYGKLPGIVFLYHQPTQEKMDESLSGIPALFGVTVFGPDMDELVSIAGELEKAMADDPSLGNIVNNTKIKSPQIIVRPKPQELASFGLTPDDVFKTIQAARLGVEATTIVRQRQQVEVLVKAGLPSDSTFDWLKDLAIAMPSGQALPLDRVADIRTALSPATVTRLNGQREITLLAEVDGSIPAAVERLRQKFSAITLPSGYSVAFTGQYMVMGRTVRDFILMGLSAVVLIYFIMMIQFRSWLQPLIILVTIPVALVGAVVALAITRVGVDISVGMGVLTLVGLSVNNAIVLLEYANRRVGAGCALREALSAAASVRLRPILMTAAVTIFALLPVALNPAVGSRLFQPFAITVIGGLLTATCATLILVPVIMLSCRRGINRTEGDEATRPLLR